MGLNINCSYNNLTELILPEGFNSYLDCGNDDINKISDYMIEHNVNYYEAGCAWIEELDLSKLPNLTAYYREKRIKELIYV